MQTMAYQAPATAEEAVMSTLMALGRRLRQRMADDSLDFSLVPILKVLGNCGPMRLTALADALELDASTVSRHVKQLEDRGYLGRAADPDDRRASRVEVTASGRAALAEHIDRRTRVITATLADWSRDDRESLRSLLDRFNRKLLSQ